jgi:hypothetical protein
MGRCVSPSPFIAKEGENLRGADMQPACNDNASSNWILPYIATLRNFLRQRETRSIVVVATTYSLISRFPMPFIDDNHVVEPVPAEAAIVLQHRSAMVLRKLVRFDLTRCSSLRQSLLH